MSFCSANLLFHLSGYRLGCVAKNLYPRAFLVQLVLSAQCLKQNWSGLTSPRCNFIFPTPQYYRRPEVRENGQNRRSTYLHTHDGGHDAYCVCVHSATDLGRVLRHRKSRSVSMVRTIHRRTRRVEQLLLHDDRTMPRHSVRGRRLLHAEPVLLRATRPEPDAATPAPLLLRENFSMMRLAR